MNSFEVLELRGINPGIAQGGWWMTKNEAMTPAARLYQSRVTGTSDGWVYKVIANGEEYAADGFGSLLTRPGQRGLLEAKRDYSWLLKPGLKPRLESFRSETADDMIRQVLAADGTVIEYRAINEATRSIFQGVIDDLMLNDYITTVVVP
jgi:hypothetical protein